MGTYTQTTHGEVNAHFAFKGANYRTAKIVVKDNSQLGYSEYFIGNIEKEGSKFVAIANKQGFIGEYKTLAAAAQALADAHFAPVAVVEPAPVAQPAVQPETPADLAEIVAEAGGKVQEFCEYESAVKFTIDGVTFELANSGSRYRVRAVSCANYATTLYRNPQDQRTAGNLQGGQTPAGCLDFIAQTVAKYGDKAQDRAARDAAWKAASEAETARINAIYDAPDTQAAPIAPAIPTPAKSIVGKPDGTAVVTHADGTVEVLPARTEGAQVQPDAEAELQAAETAARERRDEAIAFAQEKLTQKYEAEKSTAMLVCTLSTSPCKFQNLDAALRSIEATYAAEYKRAHTDAQAQYDADIEKARSTLRAARIAQGRCKNCEACAKQGFILTKEDIKQKNAYATTNGGFRIETKYTISK